MNRFATLILSFVLFTGLFVFPVKALTFTPVTQYAECDICGYCSQRKEPGNWPSCAKCLYPEAFNLAPTPNPALGYTLEKKYPPDLDPASTEQEYYEKLAQVTPYPGRYYTQLGCINTSLQSFANPAASGGLLNFLLNKLIFPTVGVLAFLALVYGAFVLATAQGNPEQIAKGKSLIMSALIGLVFTLSAIFIVRLIGGDILKIPWLNSAGVPATVQVRAATATVGNVVQYPEFAVELDGTVIFKQTLTDGTQNIDLKIPLNVNASDAELEKIKIFMTNDRCFSNTTNPITNVTSRQPTCCDTPTWESLPQTAPHWKECHDPSNSGDINMYISGITINGRTCSSITKNGVENSFPVAVSSFNQYIQCVSIS